MGIKESSRWERPTAAERCPQPHPVVSNHQPAGVEDKDLSHKLLARAK